MRSWIDPMDRIAVATGFRHLRAGEESPTSFHVLLEFRDKPWLSLLREVLRHCRSEVDIPDAYGDDELVVTARVSDEALSELRASGWCGIVRRWALDMPVLPVRALTVADVAGGAPRAAAPRPVSTTRTLVAVIDDACAFAHASFQGPQGPRLLGIWDQDPHPAFLQAGGLPPEGFGFGAQVDRQQLVELIRHRTNAAGSIDEAGCYRDAGLVSLREGFGHGTAVLDLLVGPTTLERRLPGRRTGSAAPPRFGAEDDEAARSDVVFVQLPRRVFQDGTGAALSGSVLEGLRYIVDCAGPATERIVVNLSYATDRGAHDGRSMLDQAVRALAAMCWKRYRELELVVAAGNTHGERLRAHVPLKHRKVETTLWVRIPMDNEMPVYLTLAGDARHAGMMLTATPPDGGAPVAVRFDGPSACAPSDGTTPTFVCVPPWSHNGWVGMLAWSATSAFVPDGEVPASAGQWRLTIDPSDCQAAAGSIDLWISTSQHPLGGTAGIRQARFVDADGRYDPHRYLRSAETDDEADMLAVKPSLVRREGTLSALACASRDDRTPLWVAGASERRKPVGRQERSPYSATGPAPRNPGRKQPDELDVADFARTLPGIVAAGTLSGQSVRVTGTSFAAPQLARRRVDR